MSIELPQLPFTDVAFLFAVLAGAILVSPLLARWLRLPEVVTIVLVGFAVGPTGLGLVERAGVVAALGGAGLLYLMLVAGLELDLDDFVAHRRDAIGFGVATFVTPMVLGYVVALLLGYGQAASVLLASCWASHTLITYPAFQRVGTVGNRSVATSVGATIITDTAALLVLAVVARAWLGELSLLFWVTLLPALAAVTAGVLYGLPRMARRFFAGPGQHRPLRFVFVLVALFVSAALFDVIGIEPIVGAFLVGLALNRAVPNRGPLMDRIHFVGATLFVPFFLLATGMLIDLRVLAEPRTLVVGAAFTGVAIVAKWLAAEIAGAVSGYSRVEVAAMFSLSSAQAALTLAAIVVGLEIGLIGEVTVNAVVLVILVTCLVASLVAGRAAPRLPVAEGTREYGEVVVTPVSNPDTASRLMGVASMFARADGGLVVPVSVTMASAGGHALAAASAAERVLTEVAQRAGAEATSIHRVDRTPESGIVHVVAEEHASLLVLGWRSGAPSPGTEFGAVTDAVLAETWVPTLLVRDGGAQIRRVLLVIAASTTTPAGLPALRLAVEAASLQARHAGVAVQVVTNADPAEVAALTPATFRLTTTGARRVGIVAHHATAGDVVVVPSLGDPASIRELARRLPRTVPDGADLLICLDGSAADPDGESEPHVPEATA